MSVCFKGMKLRTALRMRPGPDSDQLLILVVLFLSLHPLLVSGTNIATGDEVAIKLECIKTRHPQLHLESKFYRMMVGGGMSASLVFVSHEEVSGNLSPVLCFLFLSLLFLPKTSLSC